ncbi:spore coat putative kinase YutH [Bacillus sp. T33-2]|uniref:spore coat putative kinase YutH n=1 Tax=Bacillus sp. T33-2 TaxID=2054168 RepID=UPI000C774428|nr:spore coat protein YutH [Bacillus sp. T33-2]PLR92622.1 spore coat protein YutH [Bacillus sp. T33-2]
MFQKMLKNNYGIQPETEITFGKFRGFKSNNNLYLIMDVTGRKEQEINELNRMAQHLQNRGDREAAKFLLTKEGNIVCKWEKNSYCLMAGNGLKTPQHNRIGRKLAKFHARGRNIPFRVEHVSRVGQWKQYWEMRLDQMESVWNGKLFIEPENEFERMFLESFPYYMGLSENAIQYLVDTEMDDEPQEVDHGTVCHERFSTEAWGTSYAVRNPFDWVYDHAGRDIAEWIRERYFYNIQTSQLEIRQFMMEYQAISQLSSFSWRLLYARLLFPLHFFECVENYYMTTSEQQKNYLQDKLEKFLKQTGEHEQFLGRFFQLAEAPARYLKIPSVDWIARQVH